MIILRPPAGSAGKNLTKSRPRAIACSISLGVCVPGVTGIPLSRQYFTTSGLRPGLTINLAPHSTARSTCSVVRTVPAPTRISGNSSTIFLITSAAAAVRNVTSAQGRPPSTSALARGAASFASSNTTTGTIPIFLNSALKSFILLYISFSLAADVPETNNILPITF